MRLKLVFAFGLFCLAAASMRAQSYSPKEVRFQGAPAYSTADLLAASGLKATGTVTVKEIEAAMQRLADTGLFADTRYSVNPQALTLTLVPIDAKQTLPAKYGNFVWWTAEELTQRVHARVPLFRGILPNNGTLTDMVRAALVAVLQDEKGITAAVEARGESAGPGSPVSAMVLTITSPEIKIGAIQFDGASAAAVAELAKVREKLAGEDFDEVSTPVELVNATEEVYRDDGYLDIAVDRPVRGVPRADGAQRFLVDLKAAVHGGELYTVSAAQVKPAAPVSSGDLQKLLRIKAGDPASLFELRTAQNRLASPYVQAGYLDGRARVDVAKDTASHHVAYTFVIEPGEQYHVASVRAAGLTPEQQAEFEKSFHVAPGAAFDASFFSHIIELQRSRAFSGATIRPNIVRHPAEHTVDVTVTTGRGSVRYPRFG